MGAALKPRVLFVSTGGTLAMRRGEPGPLAPSEIAEDVLPWVPGLDDEVDVTAETLCNLDSSDIGPDHWERLAVHVDRRIDEFDGVVVIHGTDTMAWTASALSFMLGGLRRPVILTGAQRPISSVRTDARHNLIHSALCAAMPIPEVCVWFGRWLFRGNRVTKTSIESYEAFESPNLDPLLEMGVQTRPITAPWPAGTGPRLRLGVDRTVAVVTVTPGSSPVSLDAAVASGARGVVLNAFGTGNVPLVAWPEAIGRATEAGTVICMHSQSPRGSIDLGAYEGGRAAWEAGAIGTGSMTLEAATVKLAFLLGQGLSDSALREAYATPIAGEGSAPDDVRRA